MSRKHSQKLTQPAPCTRCILLTTGGAKRGRARDCPRCGGTGVIELLRPEYMLSILTKRENGIL